MPTKKSVKTSVNNKTVSAQEKSPQPKQQVVLVLQGGGALGAYQVGVYEAMHDSGIEPDWVIGTSIGAINGALIAGNRPEDRMTKLNAFWEGVQRPWPNAGMLGMGVGSMLTNLMTVSMGVPSFFQPNNAAWLNSKTPLGIENAAYYNTDALKQTLEQLVDFEYLAAHKNRLTVGAVNVRTGDMHYFDSRSEHITPEHIMASGALPPAFPAVRIDNDPYWDGGIYSNTPIEAVLDDMPRINSLIFSTQLWSPRGSEPNTISEVLSRMKDIQYSSRARSHIENQKKLHRLRHIVRELGQGLSAEQRAHPSYKSLMAWGCGTTMHVVKLNAPHLPGEDQSKDIDFTTEGIQARREAGYAHTMRAILAKPWNEEVDPIEGVLVHEILADIC